MSHYTWAYGYKSKFSAEVALDDEVCGGAVSASEQARAEITSYKANNGKIRWQIKLPE
jgi:hypothetical protein